MLIQLTTPRPVLDPSEYPAYLHLHVLTKPGVSDGKVLFTSVKDPEHGTYDTRTLDPTHTLPLNASDGVGALIYVLPFWELFKSEYENRNLYMVPFCTAGFKVVANSAFRADPKTYRSRALAFHILMPVTGGGIIRLGDSEFDVTNPSFNPWAPNPTMSPAAVGELQDGYNRAHKVRGKKVEPSGLLAHKRLPQLPMPDTGEFVLPEGFGVKELPDGTKLITRGDAPTDKES